MKNKDVIQSFIDGEEARAKNLYIKKIDENSSILFSYGTHFPMAIKLKDGYLVLKETYSQTTSRHQGILARDLGYNNFKDLVLNSKNSKEKNIILIDREGINLFLYGKINSIADYLAHKL